MTDRERFHLRGTVRSLEVQFAQIDPLTSDWAPPRRAATFTFDRDGAEEGRPASQSETVTTSDEHGLRTTIGPCPPEIPRLHGMEYGVGIDGRRHVDVLTRYDAQHQPVELNFRDEAQDVFRRLMITRDDQGRIVREQVFVDPAAIPFVESAGPEVALAEDRKELERMFRLLMPDGIFFTMEYAYDERGRVAQTVSRMSNLSQDRHTYAYDDRGNPIEEHHQESHREADVTGQDELVTASASSSESWTRHEYRYDSHGNWLERVTSICHAPDREFHRSTMERRTITYFA